MESVTVGRGVVEGRPPNVRLRLLVLTLLAALSLIGLTAPAASAWGQISGNVTNSSGDPLQHICVYVYNASYQHVSSAETDEHGDYLAENLYPGLYTLGFFNCADNNVLDEYYNNQSSATEGDRVTVVDGQTTTGIDVEMATAGSISGTVTDNAGNPLPSVEVRVFVPGDANPKYRDMTDINGEYQVRGLTTGSYLLGTHDYGAHGVIDAFYNDKLSLDQADPVAVTAGSDRSGTDIELKLVPIPPETVIDSGPAGTIKTDSATFTFHGEPAVFTAKVQCQLDSGDFTDCSSPKSFTSLTNGSHTVSFRAENSDGGQDPTPASQTFTVKVAEPTPPPPPEVARITKLVVKGPGKAKKGKAVVYRIRVTNSGGSTATGVKLKIKGKGVAWSKSIGEIGPQSTATTRVKLKFRRKGKIRTTFKVASANAGSKQIRKVVKVR